MGFFSWRTSDTNKSIANKYSKRKCKPVFMYLPDGRIIFEPAYEGYGVFGGIDVYAQIDLQNGGTGDREKGIDLTFKDNPSGDFDYAEDHGIKTVRFSFSCNKKYKDLPPPETCPNQGYFY